MYFYFVCAIIRLIPFSYFGIIIPAILNLIGLCGFNILNGILGGQALASVSNNMSWKCVYGIL